MPINYNVMASIGDSLTNELDNTLKNQRLISKIISQWRNKRELVLIRTTTEGGLSHLDISRQSHLQVENILQYASSIGQGSSVHNSLEYATKYKDSQIHLSFLLSR